MAKSVDVVVIGSGPGGYVCAVRAASLGLSTVLVEKDERLGGTCLLRGCIPTKALLQSAEVLEQARDGAEFGVLADNIRLDLGKVHARKEKVIRQNAQGVAFLMKKNGVEVVRGVGRLAGPGRVAVVAPDGTEQQIETRAVVLATGSAPVHLPHVPVDGVRVLTSDELLALTTLPEHLLVVGAGAVGMEFASAYRAFGSQVTVVEAAARVLPVEDEEVSAEVAKVYKRRGIKVLTATQLTAVAPSEAGLSVTLTPEGGAPTLLEVSHVLVAVGRRPVFDADNLTQHGVALAGRFIQVDGWGRTTAPGVYAIGDLTGAPLLAHKASAQAVLVADHLAGRNPEPLDLSLIPGCTYSEPEVGSVGMTEAQAVAAGLTVKVGRFPFTAVGKAKILNKTAGFVKLVVDTRYDQIVGVHIVGPHATDLVAEGVALIALECTAEALAKLPHAHPTLAEAVLEAAHAVGGHPIHM